MAYYTGTASADRTWYCWITTDSTSTATISADATWDSWTNSTATTTTASSNVWQVWVDCTDQTPIQQAQPLTPEQQKRIAVQRREQEERWAAEHAAYQKRLDVEKEKRIKAEKRAKELLVSLLDAEERKRLEEHNHIHVCGKSGQRYRIRRGRSGNLDVVGKDGVVTHRACVHPSVDVPDYDNMVVQKLRLEDDDEALLKIANLTPLPREAPVMPAVLH